MQGEWRPLVNYPRSALWYAALAIVPAALGLLAAHGGYLGGAIATWAMIIALPQLVFSLIFFVVLPLGEGVQGGGMVFRYGVRRNRAGDNALNYCQIPAYERVMAS